MPFSESLALLMTSAAVATAAVIGTVVFLARLAPTRIQGGPSDGRTVFLFEGTDLIDASPSAEHLLADAPAGESDLGRVVTALGPRFPRLAAAFGGIDEAGTVSLRSTDYTSRLIAERVDGRVRLTLFDTSSGPHQVRLEASTFRSILRDVDALRSVSSRIPFPVWRQTAGGEITWANRAFLDLGREADIERGAHPWPPQPIFPAENLDELTRGLGSRRLTVRNARSGTETWYECRATEIDDEILFSAVNIDATVAAETQLREFMQTLTKTFSHLTTGLAVFDRHRRLTLFNPALTDLTDLPSDFLAARPTLYSVLDRLRERRMLPEPKDYGSWRRQIAELEAAAADGTYSETWSLPENRTYRVTGRPHPGGAVAFLFEDISAEMSLTRRFRSELELGQAVIDALDDAIVVFSPNGTLSMVNRAYQQLWDTDVADTVDMPTVTELSRQWMARSEATPVWGDVRDFVLHSTDRTSWHDEVLLHDGTRLGCHVIPLTGRSTMVRFAGISPAPLSHTGLRATG